MKDKEKELFKSVMSKLTFIEALENDTTIRFTFTIRDGGFVELKMFTIDNDDAPRYTIKFGRIEDYELIKQVWTTEVVYQPSHVEIKMAKSMIVSDMMNFVL